MQDLSYNKRQQKERPSIRQIAAQFLRTEQQTQMEPFLQYIEENKLPFSLARCNTFESRYKSKCVFRVEIALGQACIKDIYSVKVFTADDRNHFKNPKEPIEEKLNHYLNHAGDEMADYYVQHMWYCRGCGKCRPGVSLTIREKTYAGLCACDMYVMRVTNPSENDYEMIKKFISARRRWIAEEASAKKAAVAR